MVEDEGREVLACVRGHYGRLGNGTREHQRVPGQVSGLAEQLQGNRVMIVAAGERHSAASTSEGELLTWGVVNRAVRMRSAKLGREVFGGSSVILVSCGCLHTMGGHTMVVTEKGRLFTFGSGASGQLGHGDTNDRDVPVEVGVSRFRGARVVFAAAGGLHSGVVTSEGRVFTWGYGL
jgi:alpha-tubulin suppressor-like RCC1 family protein